jgi:hypothetical protein
MKKTLAAFFVFAICLAAADFWQSKPASDWGEKDLQKMLNNSPWAHQVTVSMNGPTPPSVGSSGGGGADEGGAPAPISEGGGGGRGGRGGKGGSAAGAGGEGLGGSASMPPIVIRWQSALPIKQAMVRLRFGAEAATSADAKQILEREDPGYVIILSGPLRPFLRGSTETLKKAIMDISSLSVKGKDPLKPMDVQIGGTQRAVEMVLIFPKTTPYTVDDKEVEFSTKLGDLPLKNKFRFKDMVFNGKLEL